MCAVIAMTTLATLPVWGHGFPLGHDAFWEAIRIREFAAAMADGQWPPRWAPNFAAGYGYPIFNFFPPLYLNLASGLVLGGLSVTTAVKCLIIVLVLAGATGVWYCVRPWGDRRAATMAAAPAAEVRRT